jgi:hypothetical protein
MQLLGQDVLYPSADFRGPQHILPDIASSAVLQRGIVRQTSDLTDVYLIRGVTSFPSNVV